VLRSLVKTAAPVRTWPEGSRVPVCPANREPCVKPKSTSAIPRRVAMEGPVQTFSEVLHAPVLLAFSEHCVKRMSMNAPLTRVAIAERV